MLVGGAAILSVLAGIDARPGSKAVEDRADRGERRRERDREPDPLFDFIEQRNDLGKIIPRDQLDGVRKFARVSREGNELAVNVLSEAKDADLSTLKAVRGVASLTIHQNQHITDAGLAHLRELKDLRELDLGWMASVTDAGLAHVKGLEQLTTLTLARCERITDAGLAHLAGMTTLRTLRLTDTSVTDTGLAHLKGLTALKVLHLGPATGSLG